MTFDQAQSPRLGQKTAVESTTVRMFAGTEIPEAAWKGQVIYRTDTQELQIYNGDGWIDVVGGQFGQVTFVGPEEPIATGVDDLWYDSDNNYQLHRWDGTQWIPVTSEMTEAEFQTLVTNNLTIQGDDNYIARGGKLILQSQIGSPVLSPTLNTSIYSTQPLTAPTSAFGYTISNLAWSGDSWLVTVVHPVTGSYNLKVSILEFDTSGNFIISPGAVILSGNTASWKNAVLCGSNDGDPVAAVSISGGIVQLSLSHLVSGSTVNYDTENLSSNITSVGMHWDGSYLWIMARTATSSVIRYQYSIAGNALTLQSAPYTVTAYGTTERIYGYIRGGSFDLGATRNVALLKTTASNAVEVNLTDSADAFVVGTESWPLSGVNTSYGLAWDGTNFWSINSGGANGTIDGAYLIKYEGDGNKWTSESSLWWVQYAWYDADGTTHISGLSPAKSITMAKRAQLHMATGQDIPDSGNADDPNCVRFYLGRGTTQPATSAMWRQVTTAEGVATAIITNAVFSGDAATEAVNDFPSDTPAEISSTNAETVIKADGETTIKVLHAYSDTEAATTAGNKPALRVGSVTGNHLRIDGDEIQAMSNDTTAAMLRIGQGGGGLKIGPGRRIDALDYGRKDTGTTDANSRITVNHDLGDTPVAVILTAAAGSARQYSVFSVSTTDFVVTVRDGGGTGVGSGQTPDFFWFAIRG